MKDHSENITMRCPTCGSDQFLFDKVNANIPVKCANCGREITKEELIQYNGKQIHDGLENIKNDLIKDIKKEFSEIFKRK